MEKSSSKIRLSKEDKAIFRSLEAIVEGVAEVFGSNCEVVLHSLEDTSRSVVKIVNGNVTGRKVGSPLTNFLAEILKKADSLEKDVIGSYYNRLDDGRLLKSVSTLIRNTHGKPIGFMCINIDLSAPLLDFLTGFLPMHGESSKNIIEHFPINIKDLISKTLEIVMTDVNNRREVPSSERNKLITQELYKRGLFNVRGAIDLVAKEMGVSRYTVYNYIREAKYEELLL
ncbi:MAG: PAS domain-containing protein [Dehalococcoidia bacterium]|nr:PAS domain-containing protein [Dehalococcoidia bacterium]